MILLMTFLCVISLAHNIWAFGTGLYFDLPFIVMMFMSMCAVHIVILLRQVMDKKLRDMEMIDAYWWLLRESIWSLKCTLFDWRKKK